ncbi:MAG: M20 family metallopeptidase [Prochloraceae cyanobacterium]|nr:M20 family metallopeptidase [Prochloraceae cyanobacterium]
MIKIKPTSTQTARRLLDYLHRRRSAMISLLEKLVLAESPSLVPAAQTEVLALLDRALQKRNYRVRHLRGRETGGHLLAIPGDRRKNVPFQLLLGHCDTVWPLGTLTTMPLKVKQGKIYGPGVYDMKAGLVITIFALEALLALDIEPEVAPVILINSDEEIGSRSSRIQIERLARRADRAFVMEPSLGPAGKLKTQRKGVGRFTIRVIGKAAHAGLEPEKGASAILELAAIVQKLFSFNDAEKGITINVGTIDGGIRPNVIAPESKAVVDVRVLRQEDAREIEQKIFSIEPSIPGTQIFVEGGIGREPMEKTPGNQQLWQLARSAASELGIEIEQGTAGGGSDGNTTSLWTPTLDGLGAVGDRAHAPGEFVYLDPTIERSALLARLLLEPLTVR